MNREPPIRGVIFDLGETLVAVPAEVDDESFIAKISGLSEERIDFLSQQLCRNFPGLTANMFLD